jgi:hypothetical protein
MKITHVAQTLTVALLVITAWLAYQASEEARSANYKMDRLTAQHREVNHQNVLVTPQADSGSLLPPAPVTAPAPAPVTAAPGPIQLPPASPAPVSAEPTAAALMASAGTTPPPPPPSGVTILQSNDMTPLQRKVKDAPSLGKIKDVVSEHGFVTFQVPEGTGLKTGMKFDLRRSTAVVGRIVVSAIEPDAVIANIDPKSVPAGVSVQVGDEIISVIMSAN